MQLEEIIKPYKIIIFDLGGVLIDLKYEDTITAFKKLGSENFDEVYSQSLQTGLFDKYETGQISSQHFVNKIKESLNLNASPNQIVAAWNEMIKDFQPDKMRFVKQLKSTHTTALLSNTNDIHIDCVNRRLKKITTDTLEELFHFTFLSQEIKMRKPNKETFLWVCEKMSVKPEDVIFIDDSVQHIEGAREAGLNTYFFPQNERF